MNDETKGIETDLPDLEGISLADLPADETPFGHALRRMQVYTEVVDDPIAAFNNCP
jgi:hypothetical protein